MKRDGAEKSSSDLWDDRKSYPQSLSWDKARENYATLANLSCSSKAFHSIVEPILYGTLIVDDFDASLPLLKSLCRQPRLGDHVQEFHLHLRRDLNHNETNELQPLFAMAFFHMALWPLRLEHLICDDLSDATNKNCLDAVLTFWLALTPNIKTLSLSIPSLPALQLLPLLIWKAVEHTDPISSAPGSRSRFSCLEEVYVQPVENDNEYANALNVYDRTLVALLRIPTLQRFHSYCMHLPWKRWSDAVSTNTPTRRYNVRHIEAERTFAPGELFDLLFYNCPELQTLRLNMYLPGRPSFDCNEMGKHLRAWGQTLESFELTFYHLSHVRGAVTKRSALDGLDDVGGPLGNLRSLRRLKRLSVSLHALFEVGDVQDQRILARDFADTMPDSLETLELVDIWMNPGHLELLIYGLINCARLSSFHAIIFDEWPDYLNFEEDSSKIRNLGWEVNLNELWVNSITKNNPEGRSQAKRARETRRGRGSFSGLSF